MSLDGLVCCAGYNETSDVKYRQVASKIYASLIPNFHLNVHKLKQWWIFRTVLES